MSGTCDNPSHGSSPHTPLQRGGLQRTHLHAPITALDFFSSSSSSSSSNDTTTTTTAAAAAAARSSNSKRTLYTLSGEDTNIHIRNAATGRLCASVHVFRAQPIHGICVLRETSHATGDDDDGDDDTSNKETAASAHTQQPKPSATSIEAAGSTAAKADVLVWGGPWVAIIPRSLIEHLLSSSSSSSSSSNSSSSPAHCILAPSNTLRAPDWIYRCALSPTSPRHLGAAVTAHNEVLPLHIERSRSRTRGGKESRNGNREEQEEEEEEVLSLRWGRVRTPPSSSRPILYSAQLQWMARGAVRGDEVLVAAGTVFGEIVVWRCRVAPQEDKTDGESLRSDMGWDEEVEVLYVLTGHEGSIFGIDISPEISAQNVSSSAAPSSPPPTSTTTRTTRLLASCSDDRTIRIWDISAAATAMGSGMSTGSGAQTRKKTIEARETGFGDNTPSSSIEADAQADEATTAEASAKVAQQQQPLAVAMGHVSRIWNVRFSLPARGKVGATADNLKVYSFGEDATAQRWRLAPEVLAKTAAAAITGDHGNDSEQKQQQRKQQQELPIVDGLVHEALIHRHNGKHIWSSALLTQDQGQDQQGTASTCPGPRTFVATGGSDGKISIVEDVVGFADKEEEEEQLDTRSISLEISGSEVARQSAANSDDAFNTEQVPPPPPVANPKRGALKDEDEPFMMYGLLCTSPTTSTLPSATSSSSNTSGSSNSSSIILATTPTGRIFSGTLHDRAVQWDEVRLPVAIQTDLRRYQVVRTISSDKKNNDMAILGSASGNLYAYRRSQDSNDLGGVAHIRKMDRKIADIFPLPAGDFASLGIPMQDFAAPVVILTMGSSTVQLFLLDLSNASSSPCSSAAHGEGDGNGNGQDSSIQVEYTIELERGFTPTAVGCCDGHLIFGSRTGALLIYKPVVTPSSGLTFEAVARVDRPFTKDAVSAIVPLPATTNPLSPSPSSSPSSAPYFLTTSRDGRYRIYELLKTATTTTSQTSIHLRHEAVPPLGPNIESAFFTTSSSSTPELVLAGFRSRNFVVWNETQQLELANVECGGAYRSFTYRIDPSNPERVSFVWTKASRTCVYAQRALSRKVVKSGGHGREIKAVASCSAGSLLATGAEDTTLRIWSYDASSRASTTTCGSAAEENRGLKCLAVVERHTTGIQCLKWAGDKYLVSSSGNEELFIWRITRLESSHYGGLAVVCEGVYPDKTKDGDLRILSFDVEVLPWTGGEEEILILSLVLSNSALKTYRYSKTEGFRLLAEGRYTGACLMQIRHLKVIGKAAQLHVLTASTDGHIALWKMSAATTVEKPAVYNLAEVLRLHQSGVKAMDMISLPSPSQEASIEKSAASYAVVTGGDDSGIGHVQLDWDAINERYVVVSRCLANGAHAAAVTGLCISNVSLDAMAEGGHQLRVQTASNDQRVKTWLICVGRHGKACKVSLLEDRYSSVADCGDLGMVQRANGRDIVVVGVGMEFWG